MIYAHICLGGTFDRIHKGHKTLLHKAFEVGERVLIGVTSDAYVRKNKSLKDLTLFTSLKERKKNLVFWLEAHGYSMRFTIVNIDDPYGPAASDPSLEAIVVSEESKQGAEEINKRRVKAGLQKLHSIVIPMVSAEDHKTLSAHRIRAHEVDSNGKLLMPDTMREELAKPLGSVLSNEKAITSFRTYKKHLIISVGDRTTQALLDAGVVPALMIIDHRVNRQTYRVLRPVIKSLGFRQQSVASGPGYISCEAMRMLAAWFTSPQSPHVIVVDGEEDLLALPVIARAPENAVVYYGQPEAGVVEVFITKEKQKQAKALLSKFLEK